MARSSSTIHLVILASILGISPLTAGCGDQQAGTPDQAAPDLRANLEASSKAAEQVAKDKPKTSR